MELTKKAFKAYDVRGVVPTEVNAEMAYRVGRVFAAMFAAEKVVVGHDIRLSGRELVDALTEGLRHGGSDVIDIGQCGTEMIYFATAHLDADGGIMVTASHNPAEYNGMKLVRRGARPISADTGLMEIADMVVDSKDFPHVKVPGKTEGAVRRYDIMPEYIEHLLGYIDIKALKPLKIVANPGNGGAGPVLNELAKYLPFEFIKINEIPDGTFPNGVPNPLLVPNREATAKLVREYQADLGVAWDGDFDRCFLFDEKAEFIEGYYIVGLLAEVFLRKQPGAKIMYDPRLTWNTQEVVDAAGGKAQELEMVKKISDIRIHYIRQKEPRGLGHAILCAKQFIGDEPFAVLLGDDVVDGEVPALKQLMDVYDKTGASVLGVQEVPQEKVSSYGIVASEPTAEPRTFTVSDMVEKPGVEEAPSRLAVLGRYIINPEVFPILEATKPGRGNEIQLTDALKELAKLQKMYAYNFEGRRYDVGDKQGFLEATVEMALKRPDLKDKFLAYLQTIVSKN